MAGYTAFIDESGDDGFDFEAGTTDFIVLGAVISRSDRLSQFEAAISDARNAGRKSSGWVFASFKKLNKSPSQRWLLASCFSQKRIQACCVVIHKRGLTEPGWRAHKEDLYLHAAKFLIERISWACRDTDAAKKEDDPCCRIVFSRRGGLRYEALQNYIRTLQSDPQKYKTNAEWRHIDADLVEWEDHADSNCRHLAADHFASAFGCALELKDHGSFDDRYARIWRNRLYSYNGKILENGIKIWPDNGIEYLKNDPRGFWLFSGM